MKKTCIKGELQNMARKEILGMIAEDTLKRIKEVDKKPDIRVYSIGHEGTAKGNLVHYGKAALKYFKDMIIQLTNKIKIGLQVFNDHVETNDHTGREIIGEVIGKTLKTIGDKLHSLAAVYIFPKYKKLPLDIASIEANIEYDEKKAEVLNVDDVTGIALGSSKSNSPGFPGATLLGTIQAFTKKEGDMGDLKKEDVVEAIRDLDLKPSDVFSMPELERDESVKKIKQTEYEHAKRIEGQLGKEREKVIDLEKDKEDREKKIESLNEVVNQSKVDSLFNDAVEERKLDEKQKTFIEKNLKIFKSGNDENKVKDDFNKFLDDQLKEFEETAKLMGVKIDKEKDKPGVGSGDGDDGDKDFETPEDNPFHPDHKEKE